MSANLNIGKPLVILAAVSFPLAACTEKNYIAEDVSGSSQSQDQVEASLVKKADLTALENKGWIEVRDQPCIVTNIDDWKTILSDRRSVLPKVEKPETMTLEMLHFLRGYPNFAEPGIPVATDIDAVRANSSSKSLITPKPFSLESRKSE